MAANLGQVYLEKRKILNFNVMDMITVNIMVE